ncbi:aminotransferase class IV [Lutibacter sp. B2]|nr:aminotransferase class IV [Lutibacter sp. B2]
MYLSINGALHDINIQTVSPNSEGFQYGYGLFETIKICNGKLLFFDEHIQRLKNGCTSLNIPIKENFCFLKYYSKDLILANNIKYGALKILYTKNKDKYDFYLYTRNNPYTKELYHKGFYVCFSEIKKNPHTPLTYVKSANYLESLLCKNRATENGYDEVILTNVYNHLCEGSLSNLFFVKGNVLFTPDLSCGLLPGIMRDQVIEMTKYLNLTIQIGNFNKSELLNSDEIFLTNSLMDIMPVSKVENQHFDITNNFITKKLMENIIEKENYYG